MARSYPFTAFAVWIKKVSRECKADESKGMTFLLELDTLLEDLSRTISRLTETRTTVSGQNTVRITTTDVNFLGNGNDILFRPTGDFVVTDATLWGDVVASVGTNPWIGFGTAAATDNVFKSCEIRGATASGQCWRFSNGSGGREQGLRSGDTLRIIRRSGAGAAFRGTVIVQGYYV